MQNSCLGCVNLALCLVVAGLSASLVALGARLVDSVFVIAQLVDIKFIIVAGSNSGHFLCAKSACFVDSLLVIAQLVEIKALVVFSIDSGHFLVAKSARFCDSLLIVAECVDVDTFVWVGHVEYLGY